MSQSERFMKRLYGPKDFYGQVEAMMHHIKDLRPEQDKARISKQFVERIMMAVTEVNGCRYCSYFHTQAALKEGINKEEVDQLLTGCLEAAPEKEIPALYFAQHYAESEAKPQADAIRCLEDTYGLTQSRQIREYIRMIMIGNTLGNAFDALRVRVKGKPATGSSLGKELGVMLGILWIMPVILVRKIFSREPLMNTAR